MSNVCFAEAKSVVEERMTQMNIVLPKVSAPIANYVPYVVVGKMLFISGQIPIEEGKVKFAGKLGANVSNEEGAKAAELAALNVLAQVKAAVGSLDKVKRCVKLTGFVNSTHEFNQHPQIINGASDMIVKILEEKGKHARSAVGVSSLPLDVAVEVEAIFEIE